MRDVPELRDLCAVGGRFKFAVTRNTGGETRLARTHGVALSGNRERRSAGPAHFSCDERQIVDSVDGFRAFGAVIDAHRPADERGFGVTIEERDFGDSFR